MSQGPEIVAQNINFESGENILKGSLVYPVTGEDKPTPGVLLLHGGSKTYGHSIYKSWQLELAHLGLSNFTFSHQGIEESSGRLENDSLNQRAEDCERALDFFLGSGKLKTDRLGVVLLSMSSHYGARLVANNRNLFKALVAIAPAAYPKESEGELFGEPFRKAILDKNAWKSADVFRLYGMFRNPSRLFYPENEQIIMAEIQERYKGIFESCTRLEATDHYFMKADTPERARAWEVVKRQSEEFLKRYLIDRSCKFPNPREIQSNAF